MITGEHTCKPPSQMWAHLETVMRFSVGKTASAATPVLVICAKDTRFTSSSPAPTCSQNASHHPNSVDHEFYPSNTVSRERNSVPLSEMMPQRRQCFVI